MWRVDDYTLINYVLRDDMIRWQDEVIKVVNIQETDTHVIVYGIDEMDYEVEVEIPDCETVPLVVWD
jgi:hypothetical protein